MDSRTPALPPDDRPGATAGGAGARGGTGRRGGSAADEGAAAPAQPAGAAPGVHGRRFAGNALRSVGIGLFALVPALLLPAVYARTLPQPDLATWLYAASIAGWVVNFHLGIGPAASALVARVHGDRLAAGRILRVAFALAALVAAAAVLALVALNHAGLLGSRHPGSPLGPDAVRMVDLAVLGSALVMPINPLSGYFTGRFDVGRLWPVNAVHKGALTVFGIVAVLVWHSAAAAATAHVAAGAVTLGMLYRLYRTELAGQPALAPAQWRTGTRALLGLSMPAALSGLAQLPLVGLHSVVVADRLPQVLVAFSVLVPVLALAGGLIWSVAGNLLPELSAAFGDTAAAPATPAAPAATAASAASAGSVSSATPATPAAVADPRRDERIGVVAGSVAALALFLLVATTLGGAVTPGFLSVATAPQYVAGHEAGLAAYAIALTCRQLTLPVSLAFFAIDRPWRGLIPTYLDAALSATLALVLPAHFGLPGLVVSVLAGVAAYCAVAPALLAPGHPAGIRMLRRVLWGSWCASLVPVAAVLLVPPGWHGAGTALAALGGGLVAIAVQVLLLPAGVRRRLTSRLPLPIRLRR